MTLFDIDPGPDELLPFGGSAVLHRGAVDAPDATCEVLRSELVWDQPTIKMYGKVIPQPRLVSWLGDSGVTYTYSGTTLHPNAWTPTLHGLKAKCEQLANERFNSALANLYRSGDDSVAWHSDDEPELGNTPTIASVSLGDVRRFHLRHRETRETIRVDLPSGSVLVMSGRCQAEWEHQISKTKRPVGARINLTFRRILNGT